MSERQAVIVSAVRTPIGSLSGGLASLKATQLGALAVREAIRRAGIEAADVEEVIMGHVLQAGCGQNPARQAALGAGLPEKVAALTINKVCGSGLKAVMLAAQAIKAGDAAVLVAGGQESMSNAPHLLPGARNGYRLGHGELRDSLVADGLWDVYNDFHMGSTAECVCRDYNVSREDQDRFAMTSHARAAAASAGGLFDAEIIPVEVPGRKGVTVVARDEGIRAETTLETLAKLRPAFEKTGSVTAGNASQISDGAAALVVMEAGEAQRRGLAPLARIVAYATSGLEPKWVMMTPREAVRMVWEKTGWNASSTDLFELNEAFAAQGVALLRELALDPERVNVHGGAVALGHPIGASGARCLVTLLHALRRRNKARGIVSLCLGGGNGVAMAVEAL